MQLFYRYVALSSQVFTRAKLDCKPARKSHVACSSSLTLLALLIDPTSMIEWCISDCGGRRSADRDRPFAANKIDSIINGFRGGAAASPAPPPHCYGDHQQLCRPTHLSLPPAGLNITIS